MVADGGVPNDPRAPDTFKTVAGIHGSGRTRQVIITETGNDTRQFEGAFDYARDLGAGVGDTVWVLHPQRQTHVNGGEVLDGVFQTLPGAPRRTPSSSDHRCATAATTRLGMGQ